MKKPTVKGRLLFRSVMKFAFRRRLLYTAGGVKERPAKSVSII